MTIGRKTLEAFAEDVVALDFVPESTGLARETARWVGERAIEAGPLAGSGLLAPALALDMAMLARYARPYSSLTNGQRTKIAKRLARTRMPLAVDWVRAIRLLAVPYVFERRYE
jgi:hypothetical protein